MLAEAHKRSGNILSELYLPKIYFDRIFKKKIFYKNSILTYLFGIVICWNHLSSEMYYFGIFFFRNISRKRAPCFIIGKFGAVYYCGFSYYQIKIIYGHYTFQRIIRPTEYSSSKILSDKLLITYFVNVRFRQNIFLTKYDSDKKYCEYCGRMFHYYRWKVGKV